MIFRHAPSVFLTLILDRFNDAPGQISSWIKNRYIRTFIRQLLRGELDERASLLAHPRQEIKDLTVERETRLRIKRERTNERNFTLREEREELLLRARRETSDEREDLFILQETQDVLARSRRCFASLCEFQFYPPVVESALRVNLVEVGGQSGLYILAQLCERAFRRKHDSELDAVFADARIVLRAEQFEISDEVGHVVARHLVARHDVE